MKHPFQILIAFVAALVSSTAIITDVMADQCKTDSGSVDLVGINNLVCGFDFHVDGIEVDPDAPYEWNRATKQLFGTVTSPTITVSGVVKMIAASRQNNTFKLRIISSTRAADSNGTPFGWEGYINDGSTWEWSGALSNPDSDESSMRSQDEPFSMSIPVPGYDQENGATHLYIQIMMLGVFNHPTMYMNGVYREECSLLGTLEISPGIKEKPATILSITNGGKLDPLRIRFSLMDESSKPPRPLKDTVIQVRAPIPSRPASQIKDAFSVADWSLSGYFMSKTKCPNCEWKQAGSQFTSEIYYYLQDPGEPIEVLTDEHGNAELLFFLDLPALAGQYRTPSRERALRIPIKAEYIAAEGELKGELLAESSLNLNLNHIGYVAAVTYVQPQEWEPWGGLGEYRPGGYNPGEYDLAGYSKDTGTGLPYDDVRSSDRAKISIQMSDSGGFEGYGVSGGTPVLGTTQNMAGECLRPGTLFAPGDRIDLDARGLLRYKPADPQSPESQMYAKPGWVWVKFKFFDGLKAKVGVSGVCGKHSLVIGRTPEASGWMPTGKAFIYWAGQEAAEHVVSKLVPIYGQIDLVCDVAGYISWANHGTPAYIRVQSEFAVNRGDDGSATVTVREGHPAVVTQVTGFAGVKAAAGESAIISTANKITVAASNAEQKDLADGLLAGLNSGSADPGRLEPIEVGAPAPTAYPDGIVDIDAGDVPVYEDEAGDVPSYEDEAGDVPLAEFEDGKVYRFDEFSMELAGNWLYEPETADSFASVGNEDIGLFIVIARSEISSADLLEILEMDYGETLPLDVAGRGARLCALLENGAEFGCMLSFDDSLASGSNLHVIFIADSSYWPDLSDVVIDILLNMSFSR